MTYIPPVAERVIVTMFRGYGILVLRYTLVKTYALQVFLKIMSVAGTA